MGSRNSTALKLLTLAHKAGEKLINQWSYTELEKVGYITLVDGVADYALPLDFNHAIADSFWDNTKGWRLYRVNSVQKQALESSNLSTIASLDTYKIEGYTANQFKITPTPTSSEDGNQIAFRYYTKSWIRPRQWEPLTYSIGQKVWSNGSRYIKTGTLILNGGDFTGPPTATSGFINDGINTWQYLDEVQTEFQSDTDVPLIDTLLLQLSIEWRFSKSNGFEFESKYQDFVEHRDNIISNLGGGQSFNALGYSGLNYEDTTFIGEVLL